MKRRWWACGLALAVGAGFLPATHATSPHEAFVREVLASGDSQGGPFAVVDKRAAQIAVYRADGTLAARTPVLLGATLGDDTRPGTGDRTRAGRLQPEDLTTPAGRFATEPGRHVSGETVVWLDYDAAFAIHRLRDGASRAGRERRFASPNAGDRRVSAGCVVVPVAFFENVVQPLLGHRGAVVYVFGEDGSAPPLGGL